MVEALSRVRATRFLLAILPLPCARMKKVVMGMQTIQKAQWLAGLSLAAVLLAPGVAEAKRVGGLRVRCSVDGAVIRLNGKRIGQTPMRRDRALRAGRYKIRIKKLGYLEYTEKFKIRAKRTTTIEADLLPFAGVLEVRSDINGAPVLVDGEKVGTAPLRVEVDPGKHTVVVKADGHSPQAEKITARPGKKSKIEARFKSSAADSDLALMPLAPPSNSKKTGGKSGGGKAPDDLALMPLASPNKKDKEEDTETIAALEVPEGGEGGAVGVQSSVDAKPWYKEWWVWTAAGAVLAAGVTTGAVLGATAGGDQSGCGAEACWSLGSGVEWSEQGLGFEF